MCNGKGRLIEALFIPCGFLDPYEDQFEKKSEKRKERVAKNEYQRLRNIARSQKSAKVKGILMCSGNDVMNNKVTCLFLRLYMFGSVPLPPPHTKDLGKHEVHVCVCM